MDEDVIFLEGNDNFFQLPSVLKQCLLVISVETSIIHLAAALNVPVIALMRSKYPEWVPLGKAFKTLVIARDRKSWVKDISTLDVIMRIKEYSKINLKL